MSNYLNKVKQHIDVNFEQIEKLDGIINDLLGVVNLNENTSYLREIIAAKERLINSTNNMMKEHMISTRHQRTEQTKTNNATRVTKYDMPRGSGKTTEIAEKMKRDTNTYCIVPIKEFKDTYVRKVDLDTFKRVYAYCEIESLLSSIKDLKNSVICIDEIDRFNFNTKQKLNVHSGSDLIAYLLENNIRNIISYTTCLTSEK